MLRVVVCALSVVALVRPQPAEAAQLREDVVTQALISALFSDVQGALESTGGINVTLALALSASQMRDIAACAKSEPGIHSAKCMNARESLNSHIKVVHQEVDISQFKKLCEAAWPYMAVVVFVAAIVNLYKARITISYLTLVALWLVIGINEQYNEKMDAALAKYQESTKERCAATGLWGFWTGGSDDACVRQMEAEFSRVVVRLDYAKALHAALLFPVAFCFQVLSQIGNFIVALEKNLKGSQVYFARTIVYALMIIVPVYFLLSGIVKRRRITPAAPIRTQLAPPPPPPYEPAAIQGDGVAANPEWKQQFIEEVLNKQNQA